jgi:hypothetical protein
MTEQEFFVEFDMQVQSSHRKLRRVPNMHRLSAAWNYSVSGSAALNYQTPPIETVECVEVLMPKDNLQYIVDYINNCQAEVEHYRTDRKLMAQYEQDRIVRLNNPAVEKAYQKYVTLLELTRK